MPCRWSDSGHVARRYKRCGLPESQRRCRAQNVRQRSLDRRRTHDRNRSGRRRHKRRPRYSRLTRGECRRLRELPMSVAAGCVAADQSEPLRAVKCQRQPGRNPRHHLQSRPPSYSFCRAPAAVDDRIERAKTGPRELCAPHNAPQGARTRVHRSNWHREVGTTTPQRQYRRGADGQMPSYGLKPPSDIMGAPANGPH